MNLPIALMYPLDNLSSSPSLISFGLHITPPFAPPYGISTTLVFHVIQAASALTVSSVSCGWNLIPPFVGPLASLYCTLNPLKTFTDPSSILTGIVTSSILIGSLRNWCTAGSSFIIFAALSSCSCAILKGFNSSAIFSPLFGWGYIAL